MCVCVSVRRFIFLFGSFGSNDSFVRCISMFRIHFFLRKWVDLFSFLEAFDRMILSLDAFRSYFEVCKLALGLV